MAVQLYLTVLLKLKPNQLYDLNLLPTRYCYCSSVDTVLMRSSFDKL